MISFEGKNILVIGASSGIGEETAYVLDRNGANVIVVARREDKLKKVCDNMISSKKAYYCCDVSEIETIEPLIKRIVSEVGKIDGMVYSAGITEGDVPIKYLTYDRQINTFKTNYFGFVESVRQVTKKGMYNEGLRIASVSSVASLCGTKAHIPYSASKAAMNAAIRCLAKELNSKGICINSVAPSMVNTGMYQSLLDTQGDNSDANIELLNKQFLGLAEPSDVAYALAFLLSEEARFITGITLTVDGGFLI